MLDPPGSVSLDAMSRRQKLVTNLPQPPTIELVRDRGVEWNDRPKVAAKVRELKALGFRLIGSHRIANVDSMRLVALGHPDDGFGAVIYEHDEIGPWVELIALYRPGGSLTTSDLVVPEASSSSHLRLDIPGAKARQLLEALRHNVSGYEAIRYLHPKSFRGAFEDLYARQRKALHETGKVDVDAIARRLKQTRGGGRFWKVALAGCATLIVVGLVAGYFAYSWISTNFLELGEDAEQAMAEGQAFGPATDQRGCIDEALRRTGEDDLPAAFKSMMFLDACLPASAPSTPPLCEGVPPALDFTAATDWGTALCTEYGRGADTACATLAGAVVNFCQFSADTSVLEMEDAELPAEEPEP